MYSADMDVSDTHLIGMYADDTFLCTNGELDAARRQLQECVSGLKRWANRWRMKASAVKSNIVTFTLKSEPPQPPIIMYGQPIPEVDSVRYLGLTIDKKLNFREHISNKKTQL